MPAVLHVIPVRARPGRVEAVRAYLAGLAPAADVHVIDLPDGPADLEHFADDHAAVGLMLAVLPAYVARHRIAAASIGCFYDPGMWELREALDIPVVGIGEASFMLAGIVASRIAVLVGDWKWVPKMEQNARAAGAAHRICVWRAVDFSVQGIQDDPEGCYAAMRREGLAARDVDHAEAVVLGCAALTGSAERLRDDLGIPVIDPVAAGFSVACALAGMGLKTSKIWGYRPSPRR
ncbi:MAG: aspartate/glutamate racemase family protein [Armatimonadota bacterium]|nr:aspartate/glutamate racemase family protein [Armatimonadota bacterium]MDR7518128.1 aspartate/glutamate racemase family protein [Armatimonadota bacterium]MDR7548719.1 aspartate/glutamate racemase family protein [Armatimonadota bacterium]